MLLHLAGACAAVAFAAIPGAAAAKAAPAPGLLYAARCSSCHDTSMTGSAAVGADREAPTATLAALCSVVADMIPYHGAADFIATLRRHGPVRLVKDSFAPMNAALIAAFEVDRVLCHRFVPDARGFIARCAYWNGLAGKPLCSIGIEGATVAIGDASNDLPLLHAATCGILFRPSPETRRAGRNLPVTTTYTEVIDAFAMQQGTGVLDRGEF